MSRLRRIAALVGAWCLVAPSSVVAQRTVEREDPGGRDEWFWHQRSYPSGERPYVQMSMLHQSMAARMSRFMESGAMPPLGGAWRPIGPNGLWVNMIETGRIAAIVPATRAGGPMYAGTASGGVWRSNDAGITWTPLTDSECGLTTGAMALDPGNPAIVYAATGEGNGGLFGCGVLRSTDAGSVWTTGVTGLRSSGGGAATFTSLVVDATTTSVLLGSTNFSNAGIVRSTNSGATWTPVLALGPATSIVAHPARAGTYYAGNRVTTPATARGAYRSSDLGATWTQLPPLPVADVNAIGRVELAVNRLVPNSLWALVGDRSTGGMLGLFRWDEDTNVWAKLEAAGVTAALFGTQQSYDLVIAIDPRDARRIFIGGVRAFSSSDGGATFKQMAREVHVDWHVIVFDPNDPDIMWSGTDGGVYLSTDAGASWVSRSAGMAITQFYPGVSVHPQLTRVAGGTQDNGTHVYSGTLIWDSFIGGDGGYTAINHRDPTIQWGETQWSGTTVGNIFRRDANSLQRRSTGIVTTDRAQFIPPLVMDPVNPAKLYFGTFRLYRTTNEGISWTPLTGDMSNGSANITTIGISPVDTNTIYIGTGDGRALISRDGGITFTPATGLPSRFVTRVVPHPSDPLRAMVTVSGFGTAHVFETSDGFATPVRSITGNLVDAPVNVALYVPSENVIAVGTDVGVFQSADGGVSWGPGPTGMPNVIIQDLVLQQSTGVLIAGTYGRGMFAYTVGAQTAVLRGDANGDGKVDAFDALLIQQTLVGSIPATTPVYPRGDANCNGTIDSADLVLVLRTAVGLATPGSCVGTSR